MNTILHISMWFRSWLFVMGLLFDVFYRLQSQLMLQSLRFHRLRVHILKNQNVVLSLAGIEEE